ncbi:sigma-70 family RNA polymerase sigma factor [Kitasatospora sp. NPDC091276]|uniref:sigma-70 family RNA polymerase sigma factor n=1 Tax=Kitasatospora sp. NPDC091276 TaxID=3155300 RepID=UPI0034250B2C
MTHLTIDQLYAAKANDMDAISAVITETDALVIGRARNFATQAGRLDQDLAEDLAQAGRMVVWDSLRTFEGTTPEQFMTYITRAMTSAMRDHRREITRPGVTAQTAKDFDLALTLAAGDPYEAVRIASTAEMGPRRMEPDRANAALLAWLGMDSLDRPWVLDTGEVPSVTLGDVVATIAAVPVDLVEAADFETTRRTVIRDQVHRTLGLLSDRQRHVLKADHGIAPVRDYAAHGGDAELADEMGITRKAVHEARCKAQKRFGELYQAGAQTW